MPVMNGYEVMAAMSGDTLLSKIPIIVTTGDDASDTEVLALSMGANDVLVKPYKPAVIKHRLANTIKLRETAALVNAVRKDVLTGVLKKEFFYEQITMNIKGKPSESYDLICCDIERFKLVNDLFGMDIGDALLKHLAGLMESYFAEEGICGRIGVDQFACLLPHRPSYDKSCFDEMIAKVNRFPIPISLRLRFGIYVIKALDIPANVMCDRGVIACKSIKGQYDIPYAYYDDIIRQDLLFEQSILDEMEIAVQDNQFKVYYQPKYDVKKEAVVGAEALIRWVHLEKGLMSPGTFIPIFERNGFITKLDQYVWRTVCQTLKDWQDRGQRLIPISVNISRLDIYRTDLPECLLGLVDEAGIHPRYLHLEITETAYTEDPEQLIKTVKRLKALGFVIEMDDFGSGYSSLNMLSQMPLDILKLDMQFIQNETKNGGSPSILSFVISLAKWLNLDVVAEGVETKTQLDILQKMDCHCVQGYYYAKPMPRTAFEAHLKRSVIADCDTVSPENYVPSNQVAIHNGGTKRVMMIVDDVEVNRKILAEIFWNTYTIVEINNGQTAYDYVLKNYKMVDIILLDLVMPIMDGFQLLGRLKANPDTCDIPVIITSKLGEEGEARALSMGADDFIAKPYNTEVAQHRVNNALAESKLRLMERETLLSQEVEAIRYQAEHDALTGLYNRIALETRMNAFFAAPGPNDGAFITLDLDNFKTINDVFGHDKGDAVLVDIADILRCHFDKDDIITRLGGDEFAVFLPTLTDLPKLHKRVSLLCRKLRVQYGGVEITATAGVSIAPDQGTDYQTLYKNGDSALLVAKRLGKNQYQIYDHEMPMPSPVLSRNLDWLLDETSDGIMVCDTENYDVLYLNHVVGDIAGCDRRTGSGKKCYNLIWGYTEPCPHCVPLAEMSKEYCEHEVVDQARGKHYIIKGKLTEWGGKTARIQYIQDNTARAAIAKQLTDLSEDRKRLLDLMPGGIFRYRAEDNDTFDFVSENMLKMLGYSRQGFDEKFGRSFKKMVWHEDRERVLNEISTQISVGNVDECEYRIEKEDGSLCWVHDIGHLVQDENGQGWFYVTIIDITKERLITESLNEQRLKLEIALSHSGLQYWEHDLLTDTCINGIQGANLGFADVIPQYSRFLVESGIIPPEYVGLYQEKQQELYDGVKAVCYDIPLYEPSGQRIWWRIRCTNIFDDQGSPIKTIGTAENIGQFKMERAINPEQGEV